MSTGAGGEEEAPSPVATTVETTSTAITSATAAPPTVTPTPTPTPTATATPSPDEIVATPKTTVATTLAPLPESPGTGTIAELAAVDPELSRFVQALRQGGSTRHSTARAPSRSSWRATLLSTRSRPVRCFASSPIATPSQKSRPTT
ncbi:MAG: hypothetical protein ABFC38_12425 [Methanospirillum sp.]